MTNLPSDLPVDYTNATTPTGATTELPATTGRGVNTINATINALISVLGGAGNPLAITGGTLDGVTIGNTTPATSVKADMFVPAPVYTPASSTPIVMTSASAQVQVITGTTTAQTIKLPATGIVPGYECKIVNSISSANVTVDASDGSGLVALTPGQIGVFRAIAGPPTSNGQWVSSGSYINAGAIQGGYITSVTHVAAPTATGHLALLGETIVDSVGTLSSDQNYIGVSGQASTNASLGGTAITSLGQFWGGWFTSGTGGGTYHTAIFGVEIDVQCMSNSVLQKIGLRINLGTGDVANDTVRGTHDDTGLNFSGNSGATGWGIGIKFGTDQSIGNPATVSADWPFTNTSTIIGTSSVGNGLPANIGIDFSNVTFTGPAFKAGAASISMKEMASAPVGIAGAGQLYVASNGDLHYLGPGGTDTRVALA